MALKAQYDPKEVENRIYSLWEKNKYFRAEADTAKKPFCVVIPPPNITGILHMGHALNNTIQDALVRFKRMQGYETLWMPGTDHAGIATQNVVERQLARENKKKEDIGREKFTERLWSWREQYGSTIIEQLKKLGASCDWDRTRFTMDDRYSEAVREVFVRLYEKKLIYRGNYIINWCPRCKTALSDEESPHHDLDGWMYYLRYPVITEKGENKHVVVATTRPETMLGDTAVAINPGDKRYAWLKKAKVILPIMERELKVIEDEAVDPSFGTGVVKVTPAHDPADFAMGKKHGLEFINIMHDDAVLNENAGEFSGMDRFEAREAVLEVLREKKLIEKEEPYKVAAGHCYRCHTVIEPRISPQWFVKMKPLADPATKVVDKDKVVFYPERWKKVYLNWMNNIQDWCISRQIWWGHRIPVFYCQDCRKKNDDPDSGMIVSKEKPDKCPLCGSKDLAQDPDVLDTWFSSWLWPFATLGWPEKSKDLDYFYPTQVLVTASEILFFWVARMVMAGIEFMNNIPFDKVIIHGTVRDDKGIKMSKSLGNTIDPLEVIDKFGADSLRFSLMLLAASGADVFLSDQKFLVGRNFCNKIWNATRFLMMKISENGIGLKDLEWKKTTAADSWILSELSRAVEDTTRSLESFRLNDATKAGYEFFWHSFCDWYIEIAKDDFTEDRAKIAVFCLVTVLKLLHPVMPFISEEIFQLLKENLSLPLENTIMRSSWPSAADIAEEKPEDVAAITTILNMIKDIRNLKVDLGIPPTQRVPVSMAAGEKSRSMIENNLAWISRLAFVGEVSFNDKVNRPMFKSGDISGDFSLEDFDREKFLMSLTKKMEQSFLQMGKVSAKLRNEQFIANAPQETIDTAREKYDEIEAQHTRLSALQKILGEK